MRASLLGLLGLVAVACVHTMPPPQELTDARVAWARASRGPASQVNVARLRLAKQALDQAEAAYANGQPARNQSYVALRRIQTAEAEAAATLANQRRWQAMQELTRLQGTASERAEGRVENAQQAADRERQERMAAEARATAAMNQLERMGVVRREARGTVITLSGQVLFAFDDDKLLPAAERSLDSVVAALKELPAQNGAITIEGYTDSTGSRAYNQDLSERRARSVRDYLVSRGLPADRFTVEGLGPDHPVADNGTPEGRANNRRVELVLPQPQVAAPASTGAQGAQPSTATQGPAAQPQPSTPEQLPGQNQAPTPVETPPAPTPPVQPGVPAPEQR